ncbi:MAG: LCP family protein [Candidatus Dojkabacteria bacterium]|nr:LCP family protein [Candidatus Dojkabacteria bacterium]
MYTVDITDKRKKRLKTLKNQKNEKKSKKGKIGIIVTLAILFGILGGVAYYVYNAASKCDGENCNPILRPIEATIDPKLKQDKGLTNVLIVGIDTREDNPGLMNTDTIMLLTVDHNNNSVVMTSFPRDLWVSYILPNGNNSSSKINSAYAMGEYFEAGKGIETLEGVIEMISGQKIHYYVKVTLSAFVEIVDTIGGVDVEIPEYYKDAYPKSELPQSYQDTCAIFYHAGEYCIFEFQEGTEHMDGQRALIYARSRLLSPMGDFDRARRQQRVINSVKDEILSSDTLLDPAKLWDIYNIVKDNIETSSFTINDIRAALKLKDEFNPDNIGQVVLDPNLGYVPGKYIFRPTEFPGRGYNIEAHDLTYTSIQALLAEVRKYPLLYNEAPVISIYNATGNTVLEKDWTAEILGEASFVQILETNKFIQNTDQKLAGIKIYKFTDHEKPGTEEFLKKIFKVEEIITNNQDGIEAYRGEEYVIVVSS